MNELYRPETAFPKSLAGMNAVVTGGTGFIGGRLVERLIEAGATVTCFIRGNSAGSRLHRAGAHIVKIDLADFTAVEKALGGIDCVFHLAYDWGNTPWNFQALHSLIGGCQANRCSRLVHVSSFVVYDIPSEGEIGESTADTPDRDGYAHTKLAMETELIDAVRKLGVPATIFQPTIVYGPHSNPWTHDPADMLRFGTVILPDKGEGICNAVYVDDVADALILGATKPEAIGQRYLVSGPEPITWSDFYERVAHAAGAKGPRYMPTQDIVRANSGLRRILRLVADPRPIIRGVARVGPARKIINAAFLMMPPPLRKPLNELLYGANARQPFRVHMPNPGLLSFLRSRATIRSAKARTELGYSPKVDFQSGMESTKVYLDQVYV